MIFILDECIPVSALHALQNLNYEAAMITVYIATKSPDQLVAATADAAGAIIVSHDRDFKRLIARRTDGQQPRFRNAHLLKMECKQPRIPDRLIMCMPIIVSEFQARQQMRDHRMIAWIGADFIRVWR